MYLCYILYTIQKYQDLEQSLREQEGKNRELQEQIHRSQRQDTQTADYLESKELEVMSLKKALKDLEQKAKVIVWFIGVQCLL